MIYSKRKSGGAYSYQGDRKLGDIHRDLVEICNSGIIPTDKMLQQQSKYLYYFGL